MQEGLRIGDPYPDHFIERLAKGPGDFEIRTELMEECSVNKFNHYARALEANMQEGAQTIADMGSFNGIRLLQTAVGLDYYPYLMLIEKSRDVINYKSELRARIPYPPDRFTFIEGDMEELPLIIPEEQQEVDGAMALFSAYFAKDKGKLFEGMNRVVKDGGLLVFSTNSKDHKPEHRKLEAETAARLSKKLGWDVPQPPAHASTFYAEDAKAELSEHFEFVGEELDHSEMHITPDFRFHYQWSISSKFLSLLDYTPSGVAFRTAGEVLEDEFDQTVESKGYFTDQLKRSLLFYRNRR